MKTKDEVAKKAKKAKKGKTLRKAKKLEVTKPLLREYLGSPPQLPYIKR